VAESNTGVSVIDVGPDAGPAKPFRVGFIGTGGISHMHAKQLLKVPGVEIVAGCDINPKALAKFREAFGERVKGYDDYHKMLKSEQFDGVSVCTPNGLHSACAVAALDAGNHVICEKPMAMNARQAQEMVDAAKRAKRHLVIGFQYRFDPKTQLIRKQVEEGHFGKILYVRCQALRRRGIPNWGVFGQKHLQGGGPMIDIGVHVMEMAHYAMGAPRPITATGNTWTYIGDKPSTTVSQWPNWDHKTYTVEDMAVGMIRFDTGAMLTIEASFVTHIEKDVWTFQIFGEKGGATWDPVQVFTDYNGYMMNMTPGFVPSGGWEGIWQSKMRHWVEVCRDGRPNLASGEDGLMVQKLLDGVYGSAEAGREIALD